MPDDSPPPPRPTAERGDADDPATGRSDVRARGAELWSTSTGAEFIARLASADGTWDAPHAALLDYRIRSVEPGHVEFEWTVPPALLNPAGIAHGGFLVALLDDAAGLAAASRYPRFVPQLTVQLHTDFLAPVRADTPHHVVGELVRGGRTNLADARLLAPDGTLCTRSTGIFQPNRRTIPREHWEAAGIA